jgi:hypothetical protein
MPLKRISRRTSLSTVAEEKSDLERVYALVDKPYYVDKTKYKTE